MMTLYGLLWAAGGNDIIAVMFDLNLNYITYFMRGAIFVVPPIAFIITRRWCISLQRADNDKLLHGYETGIIMRSAEGGYSERHLPISDAAAYTLTARDRDEVVRARVGGRRQRRTRSRLARQPDPGPALARHVRAQRAEADREELEEGHHHAEHEHELQAGLDHPADGHQFDGHHAVEGEELRQH